jgi:hypothetical protein
MFEISVKQILWILGVACFVSAVYDSASKLIDSSFRMTS